MYAIPSFAFLAGMYFTGLPVSQILCVEAQGMAHFRLFVGTAYVALKMSPLALCLRLLFITAFELNNHIPFLHKPQGL